MATYQGFVKSIQVRDDSWVEFEIKAVHDGNATETFFIKDLDGDVHVAHRRLGHLSLIRDALARTLPVVVEYNHDDSQGHIAQDITIHVRHSIEGREGVRRIEGAVIGLTINELGPLDTVPYMDRADLAGVSLLKDNGTVENVLLDLQRPDPMTGQAVLAILRQAWRTRRPVGVLVTVEFSSDDVKYAAAHRSRDIPAGYIQACEWLTVPEEDLEYGYAFIERLGQRYESYVASAAPALSHVEVTYTTAPAQTPEGDISDNGTFTPLTKRALVHADSPLLARLEAALRDSLQVKLGLDNNEVHEVELVGHLGSQSRPIWIEVKRSLAPTEEPTVLCRNVPTIQTPTATDFGQIPVSVLWHGEGYFTEGIWRFALSSPTPVELLIDGQTPCCGAVRVSDAGPGLSEFKGLADRVAEGRTTRSILYHAYLSGMHRIDLTIKERACSQAFQIQVYRIR